MKNLNRSYAFENIIGQKLKECFFFIEIKRAPHPSIIVFENILALYSCYNL